MGLVVCGLGGGGGGGSGRGGPEFEVGMGGRGLFGGRVCGAMAKLRFESLELVGEPAETGESGPLAVLALLLEPAEEGADSRLGLFGAVDGLRDG